MLLSLLICFHLLSLHFLFGFFLFFFFFFPPRWWTPSNWWLKTLEVLFTKAINVPVLISCFTANKPDTKPSLVDTKILARPHWVSQFADSRGWRTKGACFCPWLARKAPFCSSLKRYLRITESFSWKRLCTSLRSRGYWSRIHSSWQDLRMGFKRMENPWVHIFGCVHMHVSPLLGRESLTQQILRTTENTTLPFYRYGKKSKSAEVVFPTFECNAFVVGLIIYYLFWCPTWTPFASLPLF